MFSSFPYDIIVTELLNCNDCPALNGVDKEEKVVKNGRVLKRFLTLICIFALLLPTSALAMTELEWNRTCWSKTWGVTPIYERITVQEADENNLMPQYEWREIGSLPANAYVNVHSRDDGSGYQKISFYKNGEGAYAYIKMSPYPLAKASEYVNIVEIGKSMVLVTEVPEAYLNDKAALSKYIREMRPGYRLLEDDESDNLVEGPGDSLHVPGNGTGKQPSSSGSKKTASAQEAVIVRYESDAVELLSLGVAASTIRHNGEEKQVPTAQLEFGSTAGKDKQVAHIHAPKTGKCTLRQRASESSKMVKNCKAGRIVMVLESGSSWSKIIYNGATGYVKTACLKFHGSDTALTGTGLLSYKGRTNGSTTINVRNAASGDSCKIAEWETGTEVSILGLQDGFYAIEYDGIYGFVQEKFLTLQPAQNEP